MGLHQCQVLRSAFRLLGDWDQAQEAAQEVFLRLYKFLPRIDAERPLAAWLHRVTVNACRDLYKQQKPMQWVSIEAIKLEEGWDPPSQDLDAQQLYLRREQRRLLSRALQQLPPREREALVLRDIEGLSTGEVAGILGLRESTVRVQISSARLKIRSCLDQNSGGK
jgi:RNA polymerase sigma-70 factor, ECF subfamily